MRKLLPLLLLTACMGPMVNRHQVYWDTILCDPTLNCLQDITPTASSCIAGVYVHYRGLQLRQQLIETHIHNYDELIAYTRDLVDRGLASAIDLENLITFQGTLTSQFYKLETELVKVLYELAPLVKTCPIPLAYFLCEPCDLPTPLLDAPCAPVLDLHYYYNDEERVRALSCAQEAARKSYDMTEDLFRRGLKSSIDLLDAHKLLIGAEDEYIQARVDYLVDYITLFKRC